MFKFKLIKILWLSAGLSVLAIGGPSFAGDQIVPPPAKDKPSDLKKASTSAQVIEHQNIKNSVKIERKSTGNLPAAVGSSDFNENNHPENKASVVSEFAKVEKKNPKAFSSPKIEAEGNKQTPQVTHIEPPNNSSSSDALHKSDKPAISPTKLAIKKIKDFKVCSLGHKYNNISDHEFVKNSQVTGQTTTIKYAAKSDAKFKCQIFIGATANQNISLKCWRGHKVNKLSTFRLGYLLDDGFLFIHERKRKLALLKPISKNSSAQCPTNFTRVRSGKKTPSEASELDSGLAGLTF